MNLPGDHRLKKTIKNVPKNNTMIDDVVISNVIPSLYIRLIKDEINIKTPLKNNKTPIKNMTIL